MTLVELMVALVLGLLVAAAAVASLIVARQGFTSVDSGNQLRENARFASGLIQRIVVQAGFTNVSYGHFPDDDALPGIGGQDDAQLSLSAAPGPTFGSANGVNGSDVLRVMFWGSSLDPAAPGPPGPADGTMINCAGVAEPQGTTEMASSIFHVVVSSVSGEPTLACTYRDPATTTWRSVALVSGVESMQVLYGVENVVPGAAPPPNLDPAAPMYMVPSRYLRATEMVVAGDPAKTLDNWRRVRSVRIGLVLRGPATGVIDRAATTKTYSVLGPDFTAPGDVGADFKVGTPDGRLRQQLVFNVHLRNPQDPHENKP